MLNPTLIAALAAAAVRKNAAPRALGVLGSPVSPDSSNTGPKDWVSAPRTFALTPARHPLCKLLLLLPAPCTKLAETGMQCGLGLSPNGRPLHGVDSSWEGQMAWSVDQHGRLPAHALPSRARAHHLHILRGGARCMWSNVPSCLVPGLAASGLCTLDE